ncbi:hypothetical protein L1049_004216 [Liquidambar formosana]|uniref:Uncharacterized protein n=1 Tax=Liquidambar formosana TaxID=63359 RepID=A0AAP0WVX5_LIQFO
MLVSIGPYHIEDTNLMAMKEKKLMYLHLLLERRNVSQETYKLELAKLEERARQCYADPINYLKSHEFVEMMLLDGCFIIGFLQELTSEDEDGDARIINVEWMVSQICRDMMLLENQLPYFVLSTLYDMTIGPYQRRRSFWETLMVAFNFMLPKPRPRMINVRQNYTQEIKHFLHAAHILCHYPLPEKVITVNSDGNSDVTCQQRNTTKNVDQRLTQPLIGSNSTRYVFFFVWNYPLYN